MAERTGSWDGGYIHRDSRGRDVYVIRQMINGKRCEVSTRCFTERAALEQWKRFQSDPEGYDPRGEVRPNPIYLDVDLAQRYLKYSREDRENTREWVTKQRAILAWWAKKLKGVDLRGASVRDAILPAIDRAPGMAHKVAVLKGLYSWLRRERRELTLSEDPTAGGGLTMPQPKKRHSGCPKAVPREHVELAREHLMGGWRDALDLQAATGWHITEVQRFAGSGDIEPPTSAQKAEGIAGVLVVEHKSGAQAPDRRLGKDPRRGQASARPRGTVDQLVPPSRKVSVQGRRDQAIRAGRNAPQRRYLGGERRCRLGCRQCFSGSSEPADHA